MTIPVKSAIQDSRTFIVIVIVSTQIVSGIAAAEETDRAIHYYNRVDELKILFGFRKFENILIRRGERYASFEKHSEHSAEVGDEAERTWSIL